MTDPKQDDLTGLDGEVVPTGNGPQPDDPDDQPPQDPNWKPEGTESG